MILGCIIYPCVWGQDRIKEICETSAYYYAGKCEIKWAYILAIIGIFDIMLLAILAFLLATRQVSNFKTPSYKHDLNFPADSKSELNRSEQVLRSSF